jgi:hypothetical protein
VIAHARGATVTLAARHPGAGLSAAVLALLLGVALPGHGAAGKPAGPHPHPSLSPAEVVRIQLEALRANDAGDSGIEIAFRFASPDNKRSTGPLSRFAAMIKQDPYAMMLRYSDVVYGPVTVAGRRAAQRVTLSTPGRAPVTYVFHLARQEIAGPLQECWMTEAVQVVEYQGRQA